MFTRNIRQLAIASGIKSGLGSKSLKTLYGSAAMSDVAAGDAANLVLTNLVNNNSGIKVSSVSVTDGFWVCGYYNSPLLTIYNADTSIFTTVANSGGQVGFLVKYNSVGNAQWATRIAGTAGTYQAFSVALDSLGNAYVSGTYSAGPLTIYNADGSEFRSLSIIGGTDGFLVKYNSVGNAQWVTRLGSSGTDSIRSVGTDSIGNVYVSGNYPASSLTFYNADLITFGTLAPISTNNGFIVKYNSEGTAMWAAGVGGITNTLFTYLTTVDSSGNVYVSGKSNTTGGGIVFFGNSDGTSGGNLTVSGTTNRFIAKYDSAGMVQWKTRITFATTVVDQSYSVAIDSLGNVYALGTYSGGTSVIYNSDGNAFATSLASIGSNDVYIVKYNSAGMVQWVTRMGGTLSDNALSIIADSYGNVYITGNYASTDLIIYNSDGSMFDTTPLALTVGIDGFLVKYNSAGIAQWITRMGGSGSEQPYSVTVDSLGNVYVSGNHTSNPLTLYDSDGKSALTFALIGNTDGFLVKYNSAGKVQLATKITGAGNENPYKVVAYSGF